MSASRRSRKGRPLFAIGAVISLASLGFYLYQRYAEGLSTADTRNNDSDQSAGETSRSKDKKKYKPSLSLSLPMTFLRTRENMILLEKLLSMLSQYYLVTLIAPPPTPFPPSVLIASSSSSASTLASTLSDTGGGIESVAALSHSLSHVPGFDSRRILEYSREEGRLALARALACDAHCETIFESINSKDDRPSSYEDRGSSNGESIQAPLSNQQRRVEDEKVELLEKYHADVAQIRKSSGLLIFLLLPIAAKTLTSAGNLQNKATESLLTISEVDVETLIQPFLLPGQQELSSRVPGVKVIDERRKNASLEIKDAWTQAAKRVGLLSKGWQ